MTWYLHFHFATSFIKLEVRTSIFLRLKAALLTTDSQYVGRTFLQSTVYIIHILFSSSFLRIIDLFTSHVVPSFSLFFIMYIIFAVQLLLFPTRTIVFPMPFKLTALDTHMNSLLRQSNPPIRRFSLLAPSTNRSWSISRVWRGFAKENPGFSLLSRS
jgi:hypothetical protein